MTPTNRETDSVKLPEYMGHQADLVVSSKLDGVQPDLVPGNNVRMTNQEQEAAEMARQRESI